MGEEKMPDEMKVQVKGLNKKFLFIAITLIVVGLVAALVLLLPTSAKAKKVEEQLDLGAKYLSELDYEQAIVAYEAVIKIDPKCEEAYLALADVYIATGEFEKAEEVLKKAAEKIGSDATSIFNKKKELEEARQEQNMKESMSVLSPTEVPISTKAPTPTSTPSPTPTSTPSPTPTSIPQEIEFKWKNILKYNVEGNQSVAIVGVVDTNIEKVVIPNMIDGYKVSKIQDYAFSNCRELKCVEIPDSVIEIGRGAFQWCDKLERLVIPSSVLIISEGFAPLCNSLKEILVEEGSTAYISQDGVLFDKNMECLICMPAGYEMSEYSIPSGITKIGSNAFDGCGIEQVIIPESVCVIGEHAFWNCHNLMEITIPRNVSDIGESIVSVNAKVNVDVGNDYFIIEDGVLFSKRKTRLLIYGRKGGSYYVPDEVEVIDSFAFMGSCIEEIELPKRLQFIGHCEFGGEEKITNIVLPGGIDTISFQMFDSCSSLEHVEILSGVTQIDHSVFKNCSNLKEVIIPSSVTSIDSSAFEGCDSVVIYTPAGSYTEQWAKNNGVSVVVQ